MQRQLGVRSGRAGLLAIRCAPEPLGDPIAVERAKMIPACFNAGIAKSKLEQCRRVGIFRAGARLSLSWSQRLATPVSSCKREAPVMLLFRVFVTLGVAITALCGMGHSLVSAQSTNAVATSMGEVGQQAQYGFDGKWLTAATPEGGLLIANQTQQSGWQGVAIKPRQTPPYTIRVEVQSELSPQEGRAVGGGILFAFERGPQGPTYYAALVAGHSLYIYAHSPSGFRLLGESPQSPTGDSFDVLKVSISPDTFSISLNDINTITKSFDGAHGSECGVLVSGGGRATFRNFTIQ